MFAKLDNKEEKKTHNAKIKWDVEYFMQLTAYNIFSYIWIQRNKYAPSFLFKRIFEYIFSKNIDYVFTSPVGVNDNLGKSALMNLIVET